MAPNLVEQIDKEAAKAASIVWRGQTPTSVTFVKNGPPVPTEVAMKKKEMGPACKMKKG